MTAATVLDLSGADLRQPRWRRETFHRFYTFHLRYGTHPGCVYHLLPGLAAAEQWTAEQKAWAALLNGHTQNPVTTWLLMRAAPEPGAWPAAVTFWREHYTKLAWDTDRRYHRARFGDVLTSLAPLLDVPGGWERWWSQPDGWTAMWQQAHNLPTFGRLSAWSFIEYGWLLGLHPHDAATFLLHDPGSASHRLGAAWVAGLNTYDPHPSNPQRSGEPWPDHLTDYLDQFLEELLAEARLRNPGQPHVGRLTMESALCTYKSWHRPRRRYPNVYADMAHDRIRAAETAWPAVDFGVFWRVRADALPARLRLETNPWDPGCVAVKQDWYRTTGRPPMMDGDWPDLASGWRETAEDGRYTHLRRFR